MLFVFYFSGAKFGKNIRILLSDFSRNVFFFFPFAILCGFWPFFGVFEPYKISRTGIG